MLALMNLEECNGFPEWIEKVLLDKLERFPRIGNKDPLKLREVDLDRSQGVDLIVEKLLYVLQEKWISHDSSYKMQNQVQFPPFSFFVNFVSREAQIRNDPSFQCTCEDRQPCEEVCYISRPSFITQNRLHQYLPPNL